MEKERTFSQNIPAVLFITAAILLIPFVAMQFTEEVQWSASDFIIMGVMLFTIGTSFAYVLSKGPSLVYKAGVVVAFGTTFFLIWSNLAVGLIGSGPNFANLMYIGVIVVCGIGIALSGFNSASLQRTMFAAVITLVLIAAISLICIDWLENTSMVEIIAINGFFATFYIIAGFLFRAAAQNRTTN